MSKTVESRPVGKLDTMNAVETCPICGGSGWKITEREGISGAEKCQCADAGREQRIEERAGIPPLYQNASIDNFVLPDGNPIARSQLAKVLLDVKGYVRSYPALPKPGLLFIGFPGTGKTHLAVAALRALVNRGFEGMFFDFQSLLTRIHRGYDQVSGASDRDSYRSVLETEIVVLDDVGAHQVNDWVEDTLSSIITHRCNNRKATIVTTNLRDDVAGHHQPPRRAEENKGGLQPSLETKIRETMYSKYMLEERIGMRARSRLFEMCKPIKMPDVEDYRLKRR
jgi:DNA replication protein DnaC